MSSGNGLKQSPYTYNYGIPHLSNRGLNHRFELSVVLEAIDKSCLIAQWVALPS